MILLRTLSPPAARAERIARRFPFRVGRAANADWRIEAPGVWDDQFAIELDRGEGVFLVARSEAQTLVNGERARRTLLRNGDRIECGALTLQFWLSPPQQEALAFREWATWIGLLGLACVQALWFFWLPR